MVVVTLLLSPYAAIMVVLDVGWARGEACERAATLIVLGAVVSWLYLG